KHNREVRRARRQESEVFGVACDLDHHRVDFKKSPALTLLHAAGQSAGAQADHCDAQRPIFPRAERPDHLIYRRSVMIIRDRLRTATDRLAILVSNYLRTMNRGAVLKDAKAPVIGVVDLMHSEKAAQGHGAKFARRIDADRDKRDRHSKSGLGRIAEKNNRNSSE